jgi:hypothetical protein
MPPKCSVSHDRQGRRGDPRARSGMMDEQSGVQVSRVRAQILSLMSWVRRHAEPDSTSFGG